MLPHYQDQDINSQDQDQDTNPQNQDQDQNIAETVLRLSYGKTVS